MYLFRDHGSRKHEDGEESAEMEVDVSSHGKGQRKYCVLTVFPQSDTMPD